MKQLNLIIKTAVITIAVFIGIFLAYTFLFTPATIDTTNQDASIASSGTVQSATISLRNGDYYPKVITVKVNQPVELTGDTSLAGCAKSIIMPEFGVKKTIRPGDNKITFTPTKVGEFYYTCSMGMYRGTIKVVA